MIKAAGIIPVFGSTSAAPEIFLNWVDNSPLFKVSTWNAYSNATISFNPIFVPHKVSFNVPAILVSVPGSTARTFSISLGLYSLTGSTLSLANSASQTITITSGISWVSFVTSATQAISTGQWYIGLGIRSAGTSNLSIAGFSSVGIGNNPTDVLLNARMTASSTAMPGSINTTALDLSGTDANRQPYVIISA